MGREIKLRLLQPRLLLVAGDWVEVEHRIVPRLVEKVHNPIAKLAPNSGKRA